MLSKYRGTLLLFLSGTAFLLLGIIFSRSLPWVSGILSGSSFFWAIMSFILIKWEKKLEELKAVDLFRNKGKAFYIIMMMACIIFIPQISIIGSFLEAFICTLLICCASIFALLSFLSFAFDNKKTSKK
jgi:uncharacterized membrane protein (GlpM family)